MTMQDMPRGPYFRDVLEKLVEWYDREGKQELDATYSMAWIHGYRTIHKPGDTMLSEIIDEARAMISPSGGRSE